VWVKFKFLSIILLNLFLLLLSGLNGTAAESWVMPVTPLPMVELLQQLSYVRGGSGGSNKGRWPRTISYQRRIIDYHSDSFNFENKSVILERPPHKIIPHAVGISEILWAICPRKRLLMFNEVAADPRFSIIADAVAASGRIFNSKESELIIAAQPDLVLTVVFSDAIFKQRLRQAGILTIDLGSPDSLASVIKEIKLLGEILGEGGNAEALLRIIKTQRALLQASLPKCKVPLRLLYYDLGGYIPGKASNFTSLCELVGAVNVGAEQGVNSWRQIDHETLLKWDPDIIIVPLESKLEGQLRRDPLLRHCRALRNNKLLTIPGLYLRTNSQFLLLSANLLAGIIYPDAY
jgi:iron complex transport system substrate-binding protein